jgi:hypothetical protein
MFWVRRKGRRYLYETRRVGRRVRKVYLGTGPLAEHLMAKAEELKAAQAARAAERDRQEATRSAAARAATELAAGLDLLTRACLLAAGYHQHDRGAWRRKRGESRNGDAGPGNPERGGGAG